MTKYSIKLLLWQHDSNAKSDYPIYIRITIDRQVRYLATGYHIPESQWDSKNEMVKTSHPMCDTINADITSKKHAIAKAIVDKSMKAEVVTASQIKDQFSSGKNLHNFFDFVDSFVKEVQRKRRPGTLENYRKHTLRLELYHGSRSLSFEQIDHQFLAAYEEKLREKVGSNYTHALFKTMRTIFNAAIRRGLITHYPFRTYENPKYEAPQKDYLTLKELDKFEQFADTTKDPVLRQTAVYFLLGCYTGLRISDWTKFDLSNNVKDGRIYLRATKNNEWITMPVVSRFKRHIARIRKTALLIEEPTINEKLKKIAKEKEISKYITSHTARHTFAITMCAEQGISSETCAELMGITVKTAVENYYRVTNRKIDKEALAAWAKL